MIQLCDDDDDEGGHGRCFAGIAIRTGEEPEFPAANYTAQRCRTGGPCQRRGNPAAFLVRSLQQIRRLDAENMRYAINDINARRIDAPFQRADIGAINTRAMGQLLLRQSSHLPKPPQVQR